MYGSYSFRRKLKIHPTKFPNGLKPVVDYIHRKGLKAGIYSDAGYNTCGSMFGGDTNGVGVGLYEHDQQDADFFFKDCGFDFIKVDFCGGSYYHNVDKLVLDEQERYTAIAKAIENTGRTDVRMNACRWAYPGTWVENVACSWRTTGDINDSWNSVKSILAENLYMSAYCVNGRYIKSSVIARAVELTAPYRLRHGQHQIIHTHSPSKPGTHRTQSGPTLSTGLPRGLPERMLHPRQGCGGAPGKEKGVCRL